MVHDSQAAENKPEVTVSDADNASPVVIRNDESNEHKESR